MYQKQFYATDDADWAESIELIDGTTGQPLADAADASFELRVSDRGHGVLTASTAEATIEKPEAHVVQWRFTAAQMASLRPRHTYQVGLTMTTNTGKTQLLVGSLAIVDGGF
jgi:hypothetical protein